MNREFLKALGLEKETIDKIMDENGKQINETNTLKTELESLKSEKATLKEQVSVLSASQEEAQKLTTTVDELKAQIEAHELTSLKTKVAMEYGLPYSLASRLQGSTQEELQADAKTLADMVTLSAPVAPLKEQESAPVDTKTSAYKKLLENLNLQGE